MDSQLERKGLRHLEHIEKDLDAIKLKAPSPRTSFVNGMWQGVGAVIGSLIAIALLGALLSIVGVLPGFAAYTKYMQGALDKFESRY